MVKISPQVALKKAKSENALLIEVRTPAEYRAFHAVGAENHKLSQLNQEYITNNFLPGLSDKPSFLLCKSGNRASMAAEIFQQANTQKIFVDGGTDLWHEKELPVEKEKSIISLERQVRITAGTLVFLGTLLGVFVNPYFLIIPGFVGAGLVFAGVTNTYGTATGTDALEQVSPFSK